MVRCPIGPTVSSIIDIMIIFFDATCEQLETADQDILADVFTILSSANADGNHLVVFAPAVKIWLKSGGSNLDLRRKDRELIYAIASEYSARFSLFKKSSVKLTISVSLSGLVEETTGNYTVGYAVFRIGKWSAETNLLVENIDEDGTFYRHILDEMRKRKKLPNISYRLAHGGGTSIEQVFNSVVTRKEIAVALIDSDRLSPYSECSVVEKKLRKTKLLLSGSISDIMPLPCRDIENLIPPFLIEEFGICPHYGVADYEHIKTHYENGFPEDIESISYAFFDVKMGITRLKVDSIKHQNERDWIINNLLTVNGVLVDSLRGLGENFLTIVLRSGALIAKFIEYMSSDYWIAVFDDFFGKIIDFVISDRKLATR